MRKYDEVTEDYFFQNGYWVQGEEVIVTTPKWKALVQECFERNSKLIEESDGSCYNLIKIVRPEDLVTGIMLAKRKKPKYHKSGFLTIYNEDGEEYRYNKRLKSKRAIK